MTLQRDTILEGRYRIVEILGQGGMGAVYRAIDDNLGVHVAVKENLFTSAEYARQFRREAIILANMKQANLPKVTDHFEIEDQGQYFIMEYIEGEDLRQRMDRLGIMPEQEIVITGAAICDALYYLHTRTPQILHRDIKPGNIKINPEGGIYLVDFGLAKIVEGTEATTSGARAMTPGYSSPEQYGTARTDERSDIYSLGATLYAALTGVIPEDGLARAMDQTDLTSLRKRNPKVSRRVASVIEKALEIHPDDRYQDANEFKDALLKATQGTQPNTKELTVTPPPPEAIEAIERGERIKSQPISTPIISGESISRRRRRKWLSGWRIGGIALSLFAIIVSLSYIFANFSGFVRLLSAVDDTAATSVAALVSGGTPGQGVFGGASGMLVPTFTPSPAGEQTEAVSPTPITLGTIPPTPTPSPIIFGEEGEFDLLVTFVSDARGEFQIWMMPIKTPDLAFQLTRMQGGACQPAWSPDGSKLAFISPCSEKKRIYTNSQLWVINSDGTGLQLLLNNTGVFDPAWSPDGRHLLFTLARDAARTQIFRYDFQTGEALIMTGGEEVNRLNFQPAWSPDGQRLVFVSDRFNGMRLWVMDNQPGAEPIILTRSGPFENTRPVWAADGFVYFEQKPIESTRYPLVLKVSLDMLAITDPINYREQRVAFGTSEIPESSPHLSPDMQLIIYESWPDGDNHDIWVMYIDGTQTFRVTNRASYEFMPLFKP
jgi:serine/threonine protein kinase